MTAEILGNVLAELLGSTREIPQIATDPVGAKLDLEANQVGLKASDDIPGISPNQRPQQCEECLGVKY